MKPKRNAALIEFLAALATVEAREDFAKRCGTSLSFVRQVAYGHKQAGESLAINIDRETKGFVTCESLRDDVDFGYLRGTSRRRLSAVAGKGRAAA